jgi:hypothetical protein
MRFLSTISGQRESDQSGHVIMVFRSRHRKSDQSYLYWGIQLPILAPVRADRSSPLLSVTEAG